jgi:preprotein translocase subunit SecE
MIAKLINYIKDAKRELSKVTWLTRKEVVNYTSIVIGISLGTAVFLGALDLGFNRALQYLIFR